ncbi:MAG: hypothetical protein ABI538_04205 [Pseudoxanthomonas sp.]
MKTGLAALIALALAPVCASAANDSVHFSGSVQSDNATPTRFEMTVANGKASRIVLADGTVIELTAASADDAAATSDVRLLDSAGKQLHHAKAPHEVTSKSFSYSICKGQVTFTSPSSEPVGCVGS